MTDVWEVTLRVHIPRHAPENFDPRGLDLADLVGFKTELHGWDLAQDNSTYGQIRREAVKFRENLDNILSDRDLPARNRAAIILHAKVESLISRIVRESQHSLTQQEYLKLAWLVKPIHDDILSDIFLIDPNSHRAVTLFPGLNL